MALQEPFGNTPAESGFAQHDSYGISYDSQRSARRLVKLGVIGGGGVAQARYFPALSRLRMIWEPVEITAFAEPRADHAHKIQSVYGGTYYPDYEEMLAREPLDGVIVLSPDHMHAEHTLACLESGLPVLVEQPVARALAHAERMCRAADERKLPLMVAAARRSSPPYRHAKRLIAGGAVGVPALFSGKMVLNDAKIDLFEEATISLFDLARYMLGDIVSVYAIGVNRYGRGAYPLDNATMTLRFASDAVGGLVTSASALRFKPGERIEIIGDQRWLSVEDGYELIVYGGESSPAQVFRPPSGLVFDEEYSGYMGVIESFAQAIRGKGALIASGWDGYKAFEVLTAAQLSLSRKAPVTLPLKAAEADEEVAAWFAAWAWRGDRV